MGMMANSDFFCDIADSITNAIFPLKCLKCSNFINRDRKSKYTLALFSDVSSLKIDMELVRVLFSEFFCDKCINEEGFTISEIHSCSYFRCAPKIKICGRETLLCGEEDDNDKYCIGRIRACGMYNGLLQETIHSFKYNGKIQLARPLGMLLFLTFQKYFSQSYIDLIIPIPLHRAKLVRRGFNQSFLLIKDFKKFQKQIIKLPFRWEINYNILSRIRNTKSQTGFDRKARKKNIHGAFRLVHPDKVENRRILLVDDVYTTGATIMEAASVLFNGGARSVDVLVIAKA